MFFSKKPSSRLALAGLSLGASALLVGTMSACTSGAGGTSSTSKTSGAAGAKQPNIMMILMDDLGYTDLGAYGGETETPNLDALANQSAQFTDFHASPLCAPTRAELLTGQDRHMVGLGSMEGMAPPGVSLETPGYKGSLDGDFTSIATTLGKAGYDTYQVGKWHLGMETGQTPKDIGFDQNFTLFDAGASYFPDAKRLFDRPAQPFDTVIYNQNGKNLDKVPDNFFATRSYTDEMIKMVDHSKDTGKPFFGYLAYTAPHDPLHVEDKTLIKKYADLYLNKDYAALRDARIKSMVDKGLIKDGTPTRWIDRTPKWDTLTPEQQKDLAYRMATYAAVIHEADAQIGRLITHLKETGKYDNTLIAVVSDNGASASTQVMYEAFSKQPDWHKNNYPKIGSIDAYGEEGSFASIGFHSAQVASGPYFQAKNTLFEGGTRVPALIKTPAGSGPADHRVVNTFAHMTDLYPTFMDYAGVKEGSVPNLLGNTARPVLEGTSDKIGTDEFGWEHFGHRAYRSGDWKLIFTPTPMGGNGQYQLFNLADDPGETKDVINEHPDVAKDLEAKWDAFAKANNIAVVDFAKVNEVAPKAADRWYMMDWATETTRVGG